MQFNVSCLLQNFLSGLMIFAELLPLPLPVQVPQVKYYLLKHKYAT